MPGGATSEALRGHVPRAWESRDSHTPKQVRDGLAEEPKEWPRAQQGGAGAPRGPGICPSLPSSCGTGLPHRPMAGAPALSSAALSFLTASPTMVWPRHSTCQPLKGLLGHHPLTPHRHQHPAASSGLLPCGRARPDPHQCLPLVLSRSLLSSWPWGLVSSPAPSCQGHQQDALLACPPVSL